TGSWIAPATASCCRQPTCQAPMKTSSPSSCASCNAGVCSGKTMPARPCARISDCRSRRLPHGVPLKHRREAGGIPLLPTPILVVTFHTSRSHVAGTWSAPVELAGSLFDGGHYEKCGIRRCTGSLVRSRRSDHVGGLPPQHSRTRHPGDCDHLAPRIDAG